MPFYETVYEDGTYSVGEYADETEAVEGAKAQHERAKSGEPGGPAGQPANRVVKLLNHGDSHPGDATAEGTLSKDEVREMLKDFGDVVNTDQLVMAVRESVNPHNPDRGPHDSGYKSPAKSEVDLEKAGIN